LKNHGNLECFVSEDAKKKDEKDEDKEEDEDKDDKGDVRVEIPYRNGR
jgi:hypothetical protein